MVYKFGGSSVRDAERMREVADIICSFPQYLPCVVLSAMGKVRVWVEGGGRGAQSNLKWSSTAHGPWDCTCGHQARVADSRLRRGLPSFTRPHTTRALQIVGCIPPPSSRVRQFNDLYHCLDASRPPTCCSSAVSWL